MKRTLVQHYKQCDICHKTDLLDGVDFVGSDWHHDHKIDECMTCNKNGTIIHQKDLTPEERERGKHIKDFWWWVPHA